MAGIANGKVQARSSVGFAGSLIRSIHPRAERAPFPDANLANIGGAIIPALGRRWRPSGE
jgi:hypothetical protein